MATISLCLHRGLPSVLVCVLISFSYGNTSHIGSLGATDNGLTLPQLPLWRLYVQIWSHSAVLCVKTSVYKFGGRDTIQPITGAFTMTYWKMMRLQIKVVAMWIQRRDQILEISYSQNWKDGGIKQMWWRHKNKAWGQVRVTLKYIYFHLFTVSEFKIESFM